MTRLDTPLKLLNAKADLEGDLGLLVLDCTTCGRTVHWVWDSGVTRDTGHIESQLRTASR